MHEFEDRDLDLLRATRGDGLEMNTSETVIGRARLEREVVERERTGLTASRTRRRSSTRFVPVIAIGGLVAAAALGVALLLPAPIAVKAEAAEILLAAAEQVEFESTQIAPDQYLRVERKVFELAKTFDSSGDEILFVQGGQSTATLEAFEDGSLKSLGEATSPMEFIGLVGANQTPAAEVEARAAVESEGPAVWGGLVVAMTGSGVRLIEKNPADLEQSEPRDSPYQRQHQYQFLINRERHLNAPRDPASLRQYILSDVGPHDTSDDEAVFMWVRQLVFDPSMPAELRAAGFKVLAELQGATINDDHAKIGNREGTSLSFSALGDTREDLVFDAVTGELLGTQTVLVREGDRFRGVPIGTVIFSVELDFSVV